VDDAASGRDVQVLLERLTVIDVAAPAPPALRAWDLGPGETGALRVALHGRAREYGVILDDLQARRAAASLGVAVVGSLGVVMRAKRRGIVESARRLFGELRAAGLFATDELIEAAAREVGE
jgi:predicted nucleic acid-binding protein